MLKSKIIPTRWQIDSSKRVLDINKIDKIYKGIRMENGTMTNKLNAT